MRFLIVFICSLCASAAGAADWRPLSEDTEGNKYWIDGDSRDVNGAQVTFWERLDFPKDRGTKVQQVVSRIQVDCTAQRFKVMETIAYSAKGTMVRHDRAEPLDDGWSSVVPDTVSESFSKSACSPLPR